MKNLLITFMLVICVFNINTNNTYAQSYDATGNVIAVLSFGLQDVAYIINEENSDLYKTVLYESGILILNEEVILRYDLSNPEEAMVIKESGAQIPCFRESVGSQSCSGLCVLYEDSSEMVVSFVSDGYIINYSSNKMSGGNISSSISLTKESSDLEIVSSFLLNKEDQDTIYRLHTHRDVLDEADRLNSVTSLSVEDWEDVTAIYENFLLSFKQDENSLFFSDLGQNTAFHFSSFNIVKRSIETESPCECTPLPFYFTSTTPFMCQEDLIFDINYMKTVLDENKTFFISKYNEEVVDDVENYLLSVSEDFLTFSQVYLELEDKVFTDDDLDDVYKWCSLQGSTHGCCGNYSGCCWYSHVACLLHDLDCISCDHWYCGFACEPG